MTPENPSLPPVVSRSEWLAARRELLEKEKAYTRAGDALAAERRRLPMVRLEKDYAFEGPQGRRTLLDLFEGRRQLIVYHFMFDPAWDEGCPGCSFIADNMGHPAHLHARDTSLVVISRGPLAKLLAFRKRMGWTFPWYSSEASDFNYDFHATLDERVAPLDYNYGPLPDHYKPAEGGSTEAHGASAFLRNGKEVFHTYSTYARGCETLLGTYRYLDLTALGRQEDWEEPSGRSNSPPMRWMRHHDRYQPAEVVQLGASRPQ